VSDALRADAYKALSQLAAINLQIAEATLRQQEAMKAFESAKAALLGACGPDFQMDQEKLKQETFVCVAKPATSQPSK